MQTFWKGDGRLKKVAELQKSFFQCFSCKVFPKLPTLYPPLLNAYTQFFDNCWLVTVLCVHFSLLQAGDTSCPMCSENMVASDVKHIKDPSSHLKAAEEN